ncbi:MAG: MerR family transcriptional regulator [Pseudomonadales bacterium]
MKISDVSKQLGIPASTIRYYESEGLIDRQSRVSGRREFDAQAVLVLRFVQLAQAAGFSINEMKSLLESYDQDPSPSGMWRSLAEAKRQSVRGQIKELRRMDRILGQLLDCDCETLYECVDGALACGK